METKILRPEQYLAIGTLKLPFPSQDITVEEVREMYQLNYPMLADATISGPILEGEVLIYEATPPPVKTKGSEEGTKMSLGERLLDERKLLAEKEDPLVFISGKQVSILARLLKQPERIPETTLAPICIPPY